MERQKHGLVALLPRTDAIRFIIKILKASCGLDAKQDAALHTLSALHRLCLVAEGDVRSVASALNFLTKSRLKCTNTI